MGGGISVEGAADFEFLQFKQRKFEKELTIPLAKQVKHFTPASFPLTPLIDLDVNLKCNKSWDYLINQQYPNSDGTVLSGITVFYHEFYKRLAMFDSKGMFEAVLSRYSGTTNKTAAKGSILIRIVKYVLSIKEDSDRVQKNLLILGRSHRQKQIRPWQYSVFIETLLNTLSSQLGVEATADVMHAWVNLFAFVLQSMLPPAIDGLTLPNELNVNSSSIFDSIDPLRVFSASPSSAVAAAAGPSSSQIPRRISPIPLLESVGNHYEEEVENLESILTRNNQNLFEIGHHLDSYQPMSTKHVV